MGNKTLRHVTVPMFDFKYDNESGEFTCYGNVKNIIDHAGDRTVHGCFVKSIERHKSAGTAMDAQPERTTCRPLVGYEGRRNRSVLERSSF